MSPPLNGPRPKIFPAAEEAGTIKSRPIPTRFPSGVQRRTFPLLTPEEWRMGLREKVSKIGRQDPTKASIISRMLLFYRGTAGEREEFERFGIPVPDMRLQGALPGGMPVEEAALASDVEAIEAQVPLFA